MAAAAKSSTCPIPHTSRDQFWVLAGIGIGLATAWWFRQQEGWSRHASFPPCVLRDPPTVVQTSAMRISEAVGGASNGEDRISLAHVHVEQPTCEAVQVPLFDEYVHVLQGEMIVDVGHAQSKLRPSRYRHASPFRLLARAGETLWLPRGQRYRYSFPGSCEYLAVCMPAFKPTRALVQADV